MGQRRQPFKVFCVAALEDADWLMQWEAHLRPLEQAGNIQVWSALHIQGGAERAKEIDLRLKQADLMIFLLSASFFSSRECLNLMDRALERQQRKQLRVIPLHLRPVAWEETPFKGLPCLPFNKYPVTSWRNPDQALLDCVDGLRHLTGLSLAFTPGRRLVGISTREQQNRDRVLQRLRRIYQEILKQSLQDAALMELDLVSHPNAIQNATLRLFNLPQRTEEILPPGTSIIAAYEKMAPEMLILGEPGAGKSTLLLQLALYLVERAEQDAFQPLPVLLPLSSWAVKRLPIQKWLEEQVMLLYEIPKKLVREWVRKGHFLPLLDGLDEMGATARVKCIEKINIYRRARLEPLVVCCRQAEYDEAAREHRLSLRSALVVQPLTPEQIDGYLAQAGRPLDALRQKLKSNIALQKLASTPLMLSILLLTYYGTSVSLLSRREDRLQQQVWDAYIQRMVGYKGDASRYPLALTCSWLHWLASQMQAHDQTIFFLELLQPNWVPLERRPFYRWSQWIAKQIFKYSTPEKVEKNVVDLIGVPVGSFICMLCGGLCWFSFGLLWIEPGLILGLLSYGLLTGLYQRYGQFFGLYQRHPEVGEQIKQDAIRSFEMLLSMCFGGLAGALLGWLVGVLLAPFGVQLGAAFFVPFGGPTDAFAAPGGTPLWIWFGTALSLLFGGLFICFYSFTIIKIAPAKTLVWVWKHAILNLLVALLFAVFLGLLLGVFIAPLPGILLALLIVFSQLRAGYTVTGVAEQQTRTPNEGIRRSAREGILLGIFSGSLAGLLSSLLVGLFAGAFGLLNVRNFGQFLQSFDPSDSPRVVISQIDSFISQAQRVLGSLGLLNPWVTGLIVGLLVGVVAGWSDGLREVLAHVLLRFQLKRTRCFPLDARHFLDDAVARIFLRRVGGGYSFTHRLLMDHFAAMEEQNGISSIYSGHKKGRENPLYKTPHVLL